MLTEYNTTFENRMQAFERNEFTYEDNRTVMSLKSTRTAKDFVCPICGKTVNSYTPFKVTLKDMPTQPGVSSYVCYYGHRYRCTECRETFTEDIPVKYPGTRITRRAAAWIKAFLMNSFPVLAIQKMTGIHWATIRKIETEIIETGLNAYEKELSSSNYRPKFLAVDEFALHKGHRYATCVMDLDNGHILWVGSGRSMQDFELFFNQFPAAYLTEVKAVAMDMNASYHNVVQKHLPHAQIVYDRYHMQAQFGKEVLGVVRLDEARKHRDKANEILAGIDQTVDKDLILQAKNDAKLQKMLYSSLKSSRWTLLRKEDSLSEKQQKQLENILNDHVEIASCYAMKEEMNDLFLLKDFNEAVHRWRFWFDAAKQSGIPALVKFARVKENRILGLALHASFPISTGKLEGFNNKIKVAKRIAYGYRDEYFFFKLIRFLSIPKSFPFTLNFP